ncbi:hypothetical protein Q9233_017412 [Columba guinea]|nr:hypothetical protein Q9233_017412 [Columba guinea]
MGSKKGLEQPCRSRYWGGNTTVTQEEPFRSFIAAICAGLVRTRAQRPVANEMRGNEDFVIQVWLEPNDLLHPEPRGTKCSSPSRSGATQHKVLRPLQIRSRLLDIRIVDVQEAGNAQRLQGVMGGDVEEMVTFKGVDVADNEATMIEVVCNDRLGKKVRVKCNTEDSIRDLKKLIAAQTGTRWDKIVLKKW